MLAGEFTLKPLLLAETHCPDAPNALQDPGEELWNGTGLLWILDGLDEVVDPEARRKVSQAVQRALKNRTADWFLVTCRFAGYFRNEVPLGDRFVEFHVRPLSDDQVRRFVNDWFAAAYPKLIPEAGEAQRRAKRDSEELLEILARPAYQAGRLRELCTNPLLLTILCVVFQEERKLPTGRADLYDHCVRVLLEHWRKDVYSSGLGTRVAPYDGKVARAVLARVAWWMHGVNDRSAVGVDDLIAQAAEGLVGASPEAGLGLDGTRFVERMRDESGMLALSPGGQIGFLHLTFQEYLAAEYVATEGLVQAGMIRQLAERAHEGWWREVTLLSLRYTRAFNEAFFRELLAAGMAESQPDLAEDCLREAAHFTPEPFLEVLRNPAAPAPRVAGVLRLLRERAAQVPGLVSEATRLVDSPDAAIRGFAREIVAREGGVLETVSVPGEVATSVVNADVQVDATSGVTFLRIPKGRFWMGGGRFEDESPRHQVEIAQDFWLGKYPVTNEQYRRFLDSPGCRVKRPAYFDDRRFNQPEQPVVGVRWDDAVAYCEWVGGRLPTESEWEYACRARTDTKHTEYWFGDAEEQLEEYAWYGKNSRGQSHPVGTKPANPWGLHDMHGNVWEWCEDLFDAQAYRDRVERALVKQRGLTGNQCAKLSREQLAEHLEDLMVPLDAGPAAGSSRVLRGGSWFSVADACRSADRAHDAPENRSGLIGFRVCRGGESEVARRPRD
jgi:formylglycine-generating enzyme required for sulfatase activity